MQSFLIVARNKDLAISYTSNFLKEKEIDLLDINLQTYEKAIGIENVRDIQKATLLKPFRGKIKAVVISAYEDITLQAQNALLKILEEPPANTIIVIQTAKKELLLPTIISRCKVIILKDEEIKLIQEDFSKYDEALNVLLTGGIGDKLKTAETITKNKDAILWLEKMAVFLRNKLIQNNDNPKYLKSLKELQKTYKAIKSTNVNQRTALENLFLSF